MKKEKNKVGGGKGKKEGKKGMRQWKERGNGRHEGKK